MKKSLACSLALAALGLAAPMKAETLYVPVVEPVNAKGAPLATQLWISNFSTVERPYATVFAQTDREGSATKSIGATIPGDRAVYLDKVAAEGETGLLAVDAGQDLAVNAWVKTTRGQQVFYAGLPVISSATRIEGGAVTYLNGVGRDGSRDVTQLALINLGAVATQCQVDAVAADGSIARNLGSLEVPARSLSRFEDALGLRGAPAATAQVSCDQPFYALAAMVDSKTSEVSFINPSTVIEKAAARKPPAASVVVFNQSGIFHSATKDNPKGILHIPVTKQFNAGRLSAEFDVIAGPWNPRLPRGAHNMIFFHRGRFRSNTLANVNAFGPGNDVVKSAQNIDLPPHYSTSTKVSILLQEGQTYHVAFIYDALNKAVSFVLSQNGQVLKTGRYDATAHNRLLVIPGTGLVAEFGNYNNQGLPEVASLGWKFANLHVEILPSV
ncbi:MAG TPA: hypothetical protein VGH73_04640 [Thermoanaerobaculia bacterium]